jgi:hydroxymethylpyrimidine pyrophosphatase-like HAD family hydrolase
MVSTMADADALDALRRRALERFGERIQTHSLLNKNYQGQILEFLSPSAGKWHALERLAASWGIAPSEIAAVGDDTNDAELMRARRPRIAMGNALPEVRAAARFAVKSNAEGGAAEAIDRILAAL